MQYIDEKYLSTLDFVGHMDTVDQDARILLERIGAWNSMGASGWGKFHDESFFHTKSGVKHATSQDCLRRFTNHTNNDSECGGYSTRLARYYTPALEAAVEAKFALDYHAKELRLPVKKIDFSVLSRES
jgi:hypothetical protein